MVHYEEWSYLIVNKWRINLNGRNERPIKGIIQIYMDGRDEVDKLPFFSICKTCSFQGFSVRFF